MSFPISTDKIETRLYINGSFSKASDNGTFPIHSPYTHDFIADVSEASVDDTHRAVAAAKAALPSWSALSPDARGAYLKKLAGLIRDSNDELAQLEAMSSGRPLSMYFDAQYTTSQFDHWAVASWEGSQGRSSLNTPGFVSMTFRQPIGPVAIVTPWNFPVAFFGQKAGPALAAGCTVVLKSSEKAPLTSAKIASLVHKAGFPAGVLNILSGHGSPCGSTLASHPDIRAINFTGSTATGRKIQIAAAASNLKRVILELGGKSPAIVFEDADIDKAASETVGGIALVMGQACVSNSRIYVHESVHERFMDTFLTIYKGVKKGDPLLPETTQGPQVDRLQYERVNGYLDAARAGQGKLEMGGHVTEGENGKGYFIEPTVYSGVPEDEVTQKEEVFGPFVNINKFKTEEEVLAKANDSEFGLYASVYTNDLSRALRVAKALESGQVAINCTSPTSIADMPFGGYKQSGQGREGYGYSIDEYLETKSVFIAVKDASGTAASGSVLAR
ncbi:hypothetical protein LTR56_009274 [Elasticomyces elasticus]|nr:hypothetical protein LTR56_009274 [Elasticomyces elasticus]KAK4928613.1 hypothetical protein LTR49_004736 [Elasticomyces elasticus]KAK5765182.1 hypothetical protein LTS12_004696 [Elasticomyces elasticus]